MAVRAGQLTINNRIGYYYTTPDGTTKCLLLNPIAKVSLETLVTLNERIIMRELLSDANEFRMWLHCLESQQHTVTQPLFEFGPEFSPRSNNNEIAATLDRRQTWHSFFERVPITTLRKTGIVA